MSCKKLIYLVLCSYIFLTACTTPQKSRLLATSVAFSGGAVLGAATAPTDERKDLHAIYWGSILGLGAAVLANYYFSEENENEKLVLENKKLKAEMELLQNAKTVLLKEGNGYFKNASGEEFFQGGKAHWRIYQVDKWSKDGPNRIFHYDKMVELVPVGEGQQ